MRVVLWVRFVTLKGRTAQEHLSCHLGQSCTLKPYILSEKAPHSTVALRSFQNIYIAARSPRNRISRVFRGVSFARFWQNLANWHAHGVNFIQLWRSRGFVTPISASRASPFGGCAVLLGFKIFKAPGAKVADRSIWCSDRQPGCSLTLAEIASCQYHEKNI